MRKSDMVPLHIHRKGSVTKHTGKGAVEQHLGAGQSSTLTPGLPAARSMNDYAKSVQSPIAPQPGDDGMAMSNPPGGGLS